MAVQTSPIVKRFNPLKDALTSFLSSCIILLVNKLLLQARKETLRNRTLRLNSASVFENVVGGSASDSLTGNSLANQIIGNNGHDSLNGAGGNDALYGGLGDDVYAFSAAASGESDTVTEQTNGGTDTLNFAALATAVTINLGSLAVQPVHTNRTLKLNASVFENVIGGSASDTLVGNSLANVLVGNDGGDQLSGGVGRDLLIGGAGLDSINGGTDDDILIAGRTAVDLMFSRLVDVSNAWRSTDAYSTRITKIRTGVGPSLISLKAKINVFTDSGQADSLIGGDGTDWYFRAVNDFLSGFVAGESIDLL